MYFFSQGFSTLIIALTGMMLSALVQAKSSDLQNKIDEDFNAGNLPGLHTSLIWYQGKIISANHYAGFDQNWGRPLGKVEHTATSLHDLRSVTKSITGLLYGIALDEGKVPNTEHSLLSQFPEYPKLAADKARQPISLHHTLSMQMGMEWNENLPYSDPRNSEIAMERSKDRYRFVLDRKIIEKPGQRWIYSGGSTAIIGRLIEKGTGKTLSEYAKEKLFQPLGISQFEWVKGDDGADIAASGLRLSALDMLKIGELILNEGVYENQRIISKQWLTKSFTPHTNVPFGVNYGYFWYLSPEGNPPNWVAGFGNGGQRLLIDKRNQLIQVVFAGNYNQPDAWQIPVRIMMEFAIPDLFPNINQPE